ncbi:MAG: hypothetical protein J0H54_09240 [Rhizobiales bacterium]|nr:hypothetical protein [Hyphomicrobiales bacterium]
MASEILATGSDAASSADTYFEIERTIILKDFDAKAVVSVELKDDAGGYTEIGQLNAYKVMLQFVTNGTYRLRRLSGACGVFRT